MRAWIPRIISWLLICDLSVAHARVQNLPAVTPQDPFATAAPQPAPLAPRARPSDEAIARAIRDTLAEHPEAWTPSSGRALSGGAYSEFARQFSQAEKAHCMGPDALKHQPSSVEYGGWVFGVGGLFALPFWGAAIVRGKCSWKR